MIYRRGQSLDKNLVFAEYFNDEQSVRRNGGIIDFDTYGSIAGGKFITTDADSANITYKIDAIPDINTKPVSYRWKGIIYIPTSTRYIFDARDPDNILNDYLYIADDGSLNVRVGTVYVNGELASTVTNGQYVDIVVTDMTDGLDQLRLHCRCTGIQALTAEVELFEIYNKSLTAEEVSNLYNDARYVLPNLKKSVQGDGTEYSPDPDFDSGTSFVSESGWTWSGGVWTCDGTNGARLYQTSAADARLKRLVYFFVVDSYTSGDMQVQYGGNTETNVGITRTGVHYVVITGENSNQTVTLESDSFVGSISRCSIQEVSVEPTSKILHVTARDGTCRNLLSGNWNGVELMDSGKGTFQDGTTEGWLDLGTDQISNDNGALKITYVNNAGGANTYFSKDYDLNQYLVIGNSYRVHIRAKVNQSGINLGVYDGSSWSWEPPTNTEYQWFTWEITAQSINGARIQMGSMQAGDIIWIDQWFIQEIIPEVTNTDVNVVKEGSQYVPRLIQTTSLIDLGDYSDLDGDITVLSFVKTRGGDIPSLRHIFNNGKLYVSLTPSNNRALGSSDGATLVYSANDAIPFGEEWVSLVITRTSAGVMNIYVNGELSGSADQDSGTPAAGTTNMIIGNRSTDDRQVNGEIGECIIVDGILTSAEISQWYTSNKMRYGL